MRLNRLADKARQAIERRGGMDAVKQDLNEVKDVAKGRGTLKDKARAAGDALKQPGRNEPEAAPPASPSPDPAPPASSERAS